MARRLASVTTMALCAALATAAALPPQVPIDAPSLHRHEGFRIPSVHESAVMARRMLRLEGSGVLATVFPAASRAGEVHAREERPPRVAHLPFALPEYIADCEPATANPTILQVDIANTFRNAAAGSNVTLSVAWHPPGRGEGEYSAAQLPRFALLGWLQEMDTSGIEAQDIEGCYLRKHPDTIWAPGNDIHTSRWTRLVVEEFYWFGGFGDRARIQWIGADEWRGVTAAEIDAMRLPGEHKSASDEL